MSTTPAVQATPTPAPGRWVSDPSHSTVEFVARHLMSKVRGRFTSYDVQVEVADDLLDSAVVVTIDAASLDTGTPDRDGHLRSPDFLAVDDHPELTFRSVAIRPAGDDRYEIEGDLTIKDVTRSVTLDAEFLGLLADPWGNPKAGFTAAAELDREDWGITWNQALEAGGVLVGRKVAIEVEVQLAPAS